VAHEITPAQARARQARKKNSPRRKPKAQNETEDKSMKRIVNVTIKMLDRMSDPEAMGYEIAEEFEAIHNMMVEAAENDGISNHYTRAAAAFARGYQSNTGDYEYTHITDCLDLHSISISADGLAIMAAYICDIYADYIKFACKELGIDVPKTITALWDTKDAEPAEENTKNAETEEITMKKTYYVHYYKDFANTYNLYYAETAADLAALPEGAERITRKQALALASDEAWRRKADQAFSGYADTAIYPAADCNRYDEYGPIYVDWDDENRYVWNGRIVERVQK
jgi:hypothetical protein